MRGARPTHSGSACGRAAIRAPVRSPALDSALWQRYLSIREPRLEPSGRRKHLDLFVDLLLVRRLPPFHVNVGKRVVKSPKVYVRDTGIVHTLLGLDDRDAVLGHPVAGGSWEGFVLENLLSAAPERVKPWFCRTAAGAEIDLVPQMPDGDLWAVEIKRGLAPRLDKGFHHARQDLNPTRSFVVYSGVERYPKGEAVEVIGLGELASLLATV